MKLNFYAHFMYANVIITANPSASLVAPQSSFVRDVAMYWYTFPEVKRLGTERAESRWERCPESFRSPTKKRQLPERDITLVSISGPRPNHGSHRHPKKRHPLIRRRQQSQNTRSKNTIQRDAAIRSESRQ
jgi:hypothetical protein